MTKFSLFNIQKQNREIIIKLKQQKKKQKNFVFMIADLSFFLE